MFFNRRNRTRKKFTVRFKKSRLNYSLYSGWSEVTDAYILSLIDKLKETYSFDVVSIKLKDTYDRSSITIECNRFDGADILLEFCKLAGKYIDNVEYTGLDRRSI